MSSTGKGSSGQRIRAVPPGVWNAMVEAGRAYESELLGKASKANLQPRRHEVIKVRNESGANRKRGEVLMIGDKIITTLGDGALWCEGNTPKNNIDGQKLGILRYDVGGGANKGITELQIAGVCLALVDVVDVNHRRAYIKADAYVLTSSHAGPMELLWAPDETGEAECLVRIGRHRSLAVFKTPSGGIPARSGTVCGSAECTPYNIDESGNLVEILDANDDSFTVTVFHMFAGEAIPGEEYIQAKEGNGILIADAADCSG